jgi:hypothetical protein
MISASAWAGSSHRLRRQIEERKTCNPLGAIVSAPYLRVFVLEPLPEGRNTLDAAHDWVASSSATSHLDISSGENRPGFGHARAKPVL